MSTELLKRHAELEALGDGEEGRFLSGWQCTNEWAGEFLEAVERERSGLDPTAYQYLDREDRVAACFRDFHLSADSVNPPALFFGEGATAIMFAICAWFKSEGTTEVFYLPPLYFTAHFSFQLLGIRARPISAKHGFEDSFVFHLPSRRSLLLICDPIWYAGVHTPVKLIDQIRSWQDRTGSTVFVDGSFQYMRWDNALTEASSKLDPQRTVRVICPTKVLALHGFRFAYALVPASMRADLVRTYNSLFGSTSVDTIAFARVAARSVEDRRITANLVRVAADRHRYLRTNGKITADWQPDSGYFVFEKIRGALPDGPLMDGSYFEQKRYREFRRINLLSPSIGALV